MNSVVFSAVFIIALYKSNYICSQDVHVLRLVLFDSVLLHGCHDKGTITQWKFNNGYLFIDNTLFEEGSSESTTLLPNRSVFIEHVSLNHGGTYQCMRGSKSAISYYIEVEAPPRLIISANQQRSMKNGSIILLPQHDVTFIKCFAIDSRPEVNLTLAIDNVMIAVSDITVQRGTGYNETFSTTLHVTKEVTRDTGNISCKSNGLGINSATQLSVFYLSYDAQKGTKSHVVLITEQDEVQSMQVFIYEIHEGYYGGHTHRRVEN